MPPFGPSTRAEYDQLLQSLVGLRVLRVMYFEVEMQPDTPSWACVSLTVDSLDFGLELHLEDGAVFSFVWDGAFATYAVGIDRAPMPVGGTARSWDVTERWSAALTGPIASATADWTTGSPQSVTLRFEVRGAVVIASFELGEGSRQSSLYSDHITVFFDETEARQLTGLP